MSTGITIHGSQQLSERQAFRPPALFDDIGERGRQAFETFLFAEIENDNTRRAYYRAYRRFFNWCTEQGLEITSVDPVLVAAYFKDHPGSKATRKQELAALRRLFDYLVTNQVIPFNPAAPVRGPRYSVRQGKTPVLTAEDMRALFDSIETDKIIGLRDRALIGTMFYTFGRVGAVSQMLVEDYFHRGRRSFVRLNEKNGKVVDLPVHHSLQELLDAYVQVAGIAEAKTTPLFRSINRYRKLSDRGLDSVAIYYMVRRRTLAAGLGERITPHSFRGTGITIYLENGGQLEHAQSIAAHADPRTTKLYDRTGDKVSLDEIERIVI